MFERAKVSDKYVESIKNVFIKVGTSKIFGQSDVIKFLSCSKSKATNVMNAMRKSEVIERVTGLGSGKYKFVDL